MPGYEGISAEVNQSTELDVIITRGCDVIVERLIPVIVEELVTS